MLQANQAYREEILDAEASNHTKQSITDENQRIEEELEAFSSSFKNERRRIAVKKNQVHPSLKGYF